MARLLLTAILFGPILASAQDFNRATTATFYWHKPLGNVSQSDARSSFGLRLDQTQATSSSVILKKPIADIRFSDLGVKSLAFRDVVFDQSEAGRSGGGEPNWWIVGGIAIGGALLIAQEERRARNNNDCRGRLVPGPGGPVCVVGGVGN